MSIPSPQQTAIWKNMSLSEKYSLTAATIHKARELKRIGIRMKKPTATPQQVELELAHIWIHARP
jgi:hypothetical protein